MGDLMARQAKRFRGTPLVSNDKMSNFDTLKLFETGTFGTRSTAESGVIDDGEHNQLARFVG